jgi:hypothetical protein
MGLFKVFSRTGHEVVIGEDDKHLNFSVSLFLENHKTETNKKNLTISTTWVCLKCLAELTMKLLLVKTINI